MDRKAGNLKANWYAIYTRSRAEKSLYKLLTQKGIDCFLPLQKTLKQRSDRKKWVEEPLLRSYLFVQVSELKYYEVLNTPGAVRYVCFGGKATAIPEKHIQCLKDFLRHKGADVEVSEGSLEAGDFVEVQRGPLKGASGEVCQIRGNHRLVLRFESLGLCIHTEITQGDVKVIEKARQVA